ncbi:serine acetyltransferase [Moellerella wisconsensis]|uniref:serine acetyltransferase n=1 Tax=Moellerella wisconsensis TaxID=158849 RepID=UPI003076316E
MFLKHFIFNSGFKIMVYHRLWNNVDNKVLKFFIKLFFKRVSNKYFLHIPLEAKIGYGFYIGHGQSIVVNKTCEIGDNVNISQFTTIGSNHDKAAKILSNVYIGPNVCIVEDVNIGENVIIGASSVVTKSVKNNCVVAGVPCKVLSKIEGENKYIHNKYPVKGLRIKC